MLFCFVLFFSGTSAISPIGTTLLIGNLSNGVELYDTEAMVLKATYYQPNTVNVPKQVGFLDEGLIMMRGSDCGMVWLWNLEGKVIQKLSHSSCMSTSIHLP